MECGIQFFPAVRPQDKSGQQYWNEALHLVSLCDELGYTSVRTVEHYFHPYGGYTPNPMVFLSAAAMRTAQARLITGALLPVFNNPLKLAGEIGMLEAISPETLTPRQAFIRGVAGQPPRGYERVVLDQGNAPEEFVDSVRMVEAERNERRQQLQRAGEALYQAVPCLADDVEVQQKPVIAAGEFVWGDVLVTMSYPEGLPCSRLVAMLVALVDGQSTVEALVTQLCANQEPAQAQQIAQSALATLNILYIDGTIASLRDL